MIIKPSRGKLLSKKNPYYQHMLAGYLFNEGSGTQIFDCWGQQHTGTLTGGTWGPSVAGGGLILDGTDDLVTLPSINTSHLTVIAFLMISGDNATTDNQRIVSKWDSVTGYSYVLYLNRVSATEWRVRCSIYNGATITTDMGSVALSVDEFVVLAMTYDGITIRQYVNGIEDTGSQTTSGNISTSTGGVIIGSGESSEYLNAIVDSVLIYEKALSETNINRLTYFMLGDCKFDQEVGIPTGDLVLDLWLDDSAGTQSIKDRSGNDNNLQNGATTGVDATDATLDGIKAVFDGGDYCRSAVVDTKQGTVRLSTKDGVAFFIDTSQVVTPWVGAAGSTKPYMVVFTDDTGKVAFGYLGEEGTGETLGSEEIDDNADFAATGSWLKNHASITISGGKANHTATPNGYSLYQAAALTASTGKLFKIVTVVDSRSGGGYYYNLNAGGFVGVTIVSAGTNIQYGTVVNAAANENINIVTSGTTTMVTDSASVKQVLTPPATTGIKIYSTIGGSTQNFAYVESGFRSNHVVSYEIRKSDFQITGAISVGAWIKATAADTMMVASKNQIGSDNRSWFMASNDAGSFDKLRVKLSGDGADVNIKDYTSDVTCFDNTRHFVCFTYDGNGTLKIYVDGVEDTSVTKTTDAAITTLFDTFEKLSLGTAWNVAAISNPLTGDIGGMFLYAKEMTAAEVLSAYKITKKIMDSKGF